MTAAVFMYRTDSGCKPILAVEGRKWISFVCMDTPIAVSRVPMAEQRHMTPLDYQPRKAARKFRGAGKRLGITRGASLLLNSVTDGQPAGKKPALARSTDPRQGTKAGERGGRRPPDAINNELTP